jgi:tol-pal system protein YbgF
MKPWFALALVFLLLLGLSRPAQAVKKDTQIILDEIQKLAGAVEELNAMVGELLKKNSISDDKISAIARNQADLSQSKESFALSMQFFKEELNELRNSLNKLNDKITNILPAAAGPTEPGTGETAPAGEASLSQDPSSIYYAAYSDYIKENFDLAIEGFRQFIRSYPQSGLADNSLYWIGECHYAKKKYLEAIATFNELLAKYKDGDKVPAATLKKGYALIEMGRQSEGLSILKELISRFPLSEEASLAQQKIKEFND